jgi:hypothetical protein
MGNVYVISDEDVSILHSKSGYECVIVDESIATIENNIITPHKEGLTTLIIQLVDNNSFRCEVMLKVTNIIYTDTATDGMLGGPNLTQLASICDAAPGCMLTASGGVSSPYDVENLKALGRSNLRAAIVGKALYDGKTTLREMNVAAI